jgi:diguanylate cyclase (GGDEF)-like protein/PAS domain S-box-containing protein
LDPWRIALEGAGDGIWDWDMVSGAQTQSRRWWELIGYDGPDALACNGYEAFASRIHPEDWPAIMQADQDLRTTGADRISTEFRMRCKDGSWKWILSRAMVVNRDAQGKPTRMIGTHTDVHQQHLAQDALRELNAQLQLQALHLHTTLSSVSQGIFLSDAHGNIHTYNQRFCELLGIEPEWLAKHATRQAVAALQHGRGDFGTDYQLVDAHAREMVATKDDTNLPECYLRQTRDGRTLEVRTRRLEGGGLVRTFTDLSDHVKSEAARAQLDEMLGAAQRIARVGCAVTNFATGTVQWTDGVYRILDADPAQYTPSIQSIKHFLTPEGHADLLSVLKDKEHQPTLQEVEQELITLTGRRIWVKTIAYMTWADGRVVTRTSVLQDITEYKRAQDELRHSEARWKLALESAGDGVWDWHIDIGQEFHSPRLLEMYGLTPEDLASSPDALDKRTHPDDRAEMEHAREEHFSGRTPRYFNEHRVQCKDGHWKWVLSRGMVIQRDAGGKPLRMIGTHTDITARKQAEAAIRHQAMFDALTGLPNRRMLRDRLEQEMKRCQRDGQQLAVLFMDLDHFKEINDTLGHDQGDALLVQAAQRIQACLRASDTVARMGGDEFTVVLSEMSDATHLEGLLQKILQTLARAFVLSGENRFVSASIGVTIYPLDAQDIEELYKNADQALYAAKGAGRNRFSFYTPSLQAAAQARVRLTQDLRLAVQEGQFRLVYQPIVDMRTGAIEKAEALIRWMHPTRGLVSPADFIPVAESSGLIVEIGQWVFEQASAQVLQWRASISPRFQISVNKSPVQFQQADPTCSDWGRALKGMGLPGESIVVEITEGLLLDKNDGVADQLLLLGDAGIQMSLDDFGTGYSSLAYLQRFDIDFLKIDQSFVRHLIKDSTDLALCKAIIAMAHALGIQVIAEGVETQTHYELLREAGCDYAQGYFISKPISAEAFESFVESHRQNHGHHTYAVPGMGLHRAEI